MLMLTLTVFTYQDFDYRHTEQFCLNYCAFENILQERDGKAACSCSIDLDTLDFILILST